MEKFVDVVGYEGIYVVSNLGNVMRTMKGRGAKPGRILKSHLQNGYWLTKLTKNNKQKNYYVHRLVAEAFLEKSSSNTVNHINGIKTDNRVENLEFVTQQENLLHATSVLGKRCGEKHWNSRLTQEDVDKIRVLKCSGLMNKEIAELFNISRPTVSEILSGKTWKYSPMPLVCGT